MNKTSLQSTKSTLKGILGEVGIDADSLRGFLQKSIEAQEAVIGLNLGAIDNEQFDKAAQEVKEAKLLFYLLEGSRKASL